MNKTEIISYLESLSLIVIAGVLLILPLFFLTNTTDAFILPKQTLIIGATLLLLLFWGTKSFIEGKISFRSSPFNFPIFLFGAAILGSSLLSPNLYGSLIQAVPVITVLLFSFVMINTISSRSAFNVALSALAIGAVLSSIISILYYFQIYALPFPSIQSQDFTTLGSPVQHIAYLIPVLILSSFFVIRRAKEESIAKLITRDYGIAIHVVSSILILAGIALTVYKIMSAEIKPVILPVQHGFQIAINSLSDSARTLESFLIGSGYGTFFTDFTRFRDVSFNTLDRMWSQPFAFSSSYFFELVATTGVIGALAFLFIGLRLLKSRTKDINPLFTAVAISFIVAFLIPYSFTLVVLLFTLLAFYITYLYLDDAKDVYDSHISLVAFQKGLISFDENARTKNSPILTGLLAILIIALVGFIGWQTTNYVRSDLKFAQSLVLANTGAAQEVYDLQRESIEIFPYKSEYYRIFSQLNLALANSLVANIPQGEEPSQEAQQNILVLLQQSINTARQAVAIAPLTSTNWENLGRVYRSLIGVGENAEQFAIASINQAIALNPTDPRLRIELGGIYYQFQEFDQAQTHFQTATQLKPNYANAYYNLGHALEEQGELVLALQQYQIVRALVQDNEQSLNAIEAEIEALTQLIGEEQQEAALEGEIEPGEGEGEDEEIGVNEPPAQFPEQDPQTEIPGPPSPIVETEDTENEQGTDAEEEEN